MKVKQKRLDDGRIQLDAVASANEVERALQVAQYSFAQKMNLRPQRDKSIAEVAAESMGINDLDVVVENEAAEFLAPFAVDKSGIIPAYPPQPMGAMPLRRGYDYAFKLYVLPKPDYNLTSYDPVEITRKPYELDEAEVDARIKQIAERFTYYEKSDEEPHPVRKGENVLLKMSASKDGEPIPALTHDGRTYTTGEGWMPDDFDEAVIGMMPGETKTFQFGGPSWDEDTGEQTIDIIDCTVTVLENQKETLPTIDDAWVSTNVPSCKTVEEFRESIRKDIDKKQRFQYDEQVRQGAAAALSDRFEGSIDDAVYENMSKTLIQNLRSDLAQQGMSFEEYTKSVGGKEQFNMMLMMQTRAMLVQGYALDAVFRHFKLHVREEDIQDVCRSMDSENPKQVRDSLERNGRSFVLRESAERMRANKYIVEHAIVKEPEEK